MNSRIRVFVEIYKHKPLPEITVKEWVKQHNNELWKTCIDCGEHFDVRMQLHIDQCPKCKSKNLI